ncbi:MAG: putative porin [Niabella sp.]
MRFLLFFILVFAVVAGQAQNPISGASDRIRGLRGAMSGQGNDSLAKRNQLEDSITISYRYLDTTRQFKMDSSINDFSVYPIPFNYNYLGNTGSPAESMIFSPNMNAGWDAGFHTLDVYKLTVDKARFFTTTRPYSQINYMLGTRSEQYIELLQTQNLKPNWNAHFNYRFINAPGLYKSQKTSHNNYLFTNWIQSKDKRYSNYFILAANKLQAGTNGGIQDTLSDGSYVNYIDDSRYNNRFNIPTQLGGDAAGGYNFFNTNVPVGNKYNDLNLVMRQQYDFGRKDSLVTDSTVIPLFFPRLRLEHTIQYSKYKYSFVDENSQADYYAANYNYDISGNSGVFRIQDSWKELSNDFSFYTFPDAKNTQQYIKLGAAMQNLNGILKDSNSYTFNNVFGHGEYRNRTRNQKWDLMAYGKLYFVGLNAGDYEARASIKSTLGKNIGSLKLGFENVNRSPNYMTNANSSFFLMDNAVDFKKENTTHLYTEIYQPVLKLNLSGHYYLINNYIYLTDFYNYQQHNTLFNFVQITANKVFAAGRKKQWKWRADVTLQKIIGNAPVNVPLIYTRNRFAYEGSLGYRRLDLAFGLDTKYRINYDANNYSPVMGSFFYQNDSTVKYKLPDIAGYIHFRINSFKLFFRAENLNSFRILDGLAGWTNNNFAAPNYPYPGLVIRLGIFWGFVN